MVRSRSKYYTSMPVSGLPTFFNSVKNMNLNRHKGHGSDRTPVPVWPNVRQKKKGFCQLYQKIRGFSLAFTMSTIFKNTRNTVVIETLNLYEMSWTDKLILSLIIVSISCWNFESKFLSVIGIWSSKNLNTAISTL
jgi:hypothetical protein